VMIALPAPQAEIETLALFDDAFLLAAPAADDLPSRARITADDIDPTRLILLEEGHCLRDQALAVCGTSAGRRVANYGATSMTTLLQMVSHGMGITLIPEIALRDESSRNRVRVVPFADPQPSRRIGLVWRTSASGKRLDFEALGMVIKDSAAVLLA
jgi:LysR family hydrogen peroxide-inducible transcriptional activator